MTLEALESPPQDLVAIFHASFHPTKGNLIDWFLKADDSVDLAQVEFSCLPSGLHSINEDVVYFTKDDRQGVCVFRRRQTAEHGHRGFRLSSLGILLAKSARPRPWKHVAALKELVHAIYTSLEDREVLEPNDSDWEPARAFFEERQVRHTNLDGAGDWQGWDVEMESYDPSSSNPTMHLPHLLQILGPSSLTLYKHVLGRRRILIYTLPPVEAACVLCQVAADLCYEDQSAPAPDDLLMPNDSEAIRGPLKGKSKEGIKVLGMVTLSDIDKLERESKTGQGWIACTTDAIFLEKPSYYDLLIDLTTTLNKNSRPTLSTSRLFDQAGSRRPSYKLSTVRFTWSDVKLWTELDRIIQEDAGEGACYGSSTIIQRSGPNTRWPDVWKVYEDVCVICAGLWMGPWRAPLVGPDRMENWGSIRLNGEDDLSRMPGPSRGYVRNTGMGIDSEPPPSRAVSETGELRGRAKKSVRRSSGGSLLWSWTSVRGNISLQSSSPPHSKDVDDEDDLVLVDDTRARKISTALALLSVFHSNTTTLLARFADILPQRSSHSHNMTNAGSGSLIVLTPKDLMSFDLGPLNGLDGHFVEWIAEEYGGGTRVVVRRGWRDIVALIFNLS